MMLSTFVGFHALSILVRNGTADLVPAKLIKFSERLDLTFLPLPQRLKLGVHLERAQKVLQLLGAE